VIGPSLGSAGVQVRNPPLYGIAAVLFVLSTILMVLLRNQPIEPPHAEGRYRSLLSNRTAARILVVTFVAILALTLSWPLTPLYLSEARGLSVAQVGALGSFFALGIVFLNLTLGASPPRRGSMIGQGIVAASVTLLWRGLSMPAYAAGYFLAGGSRTARSLLSAQVERVVERSHLGLAFGVVETVASSALIVAPLLAGLLYQANPAAPYPVTLVLIGDPASCVSGSSCGRSGFIRTGVRPVLSEGRPGPEMPIEPVCRRGTGTSLESKTTGRSRVTGRLSRRRASWKL
jgi:hypothetical protein